MVFYCCVPSCGNNGKNVNMHRFPVNLTQICDIWLQRIAREDLQSLNRIQLYKNYRICEEHFHQDCILPTSLRKLKLGSLPIWKLGQTQYTKEDCIMVPRCKGSFKNDSVLRTSSSCTALEKVRCISRMTDCSTMKDSLCAAQGNKESTCDNIVENQVPAKKAKTGGSVTEVTVEPEQGLEFSLPIINPSEGTSTSKLEQYDIHNRNSVNYSSSRACLIVGSPSRKKLKKTDVQTVSLIGSETTDFSGITKRSLKRSRHVHVQSDEVNSRTTKIGSECFKKSKEDTNDQNEGPEDQMGNSYGHIFFEPKVKELENGNKFELFYLDPKKKNVCTTKSSEYLFETDEASESNGFDFVDNSFLEMDQESLDSQCQNPEQVNVEFQRLCRVCLGTSMLTHLTKCQSLVALFVGITNIEVEVEDKLPKYMCADCIHKLEGISNFICEAKKNNEKLKQTVLVDEEIKIIMSDNVDEESLSVAEDTPNMSQEVLNYESADFESTVELESENLLSPELIILNDDDDMLENKSLMPLQKRGEREQNNIENDKDFHNILGKPGPKLSASLRNDDNCKKKKVCVCCKCGALILGLELPKTIANVPPHRMKFYCLTCSKSNGSSKTQRLKNQIRHNFKKAFI